MKTRETFILSFTAEKFKLFFLSCIVVEDFNNQKSCYMMDLRVDTILISYSSVCIYHMVKTHTRNVWEGAEMDVKLQLSSLARGYGAVQSWTFISQHEASL